MNRLLSRLSLRNGVAILCIAMCACGSGSNSSDGGAVDSGLPPRCNVVISGALSFTFGCAQGAILDKTQGVTLHRIVGSGPPNLENFSMSVVIAGPPQVRSYDATSVVSANAIVVTTSNMTWLQQTGAMASGSFSLNLTSVTKEGEDSSSVYYFIHGSWNATLPANGGTQGPITIAVTY